MVDTVLLAIAGALAVLVALSAFFSSTETALFSLSPDWVAERAASGDPRAAALQRLLEDPHRLLVTVLVGNNVVNVAISSLATVALVRLLPTGQAVVATTLGVSALVLVFGEIVPKSYGLGNNERWALAVVRPVRVVERVLYPVVAAFDAVTRRLTRFVGGATAIEDPYLDD